MGYPIETTEIYPMADAGNRGAGRPTIRDAEPSIKDALQVMEPKIEAVE